MIKQKTLKKAIVSTALINILSRTLGYVKTIVLIVFAGMGDELDAYIIAYSVVTVYIIVFGDIFDSLGVPELSRAWSKNKRELFDKITKNLFFLSFVLTLFLSLALCFSYHYFLNIQAIGFSNEKRELVINMLYYLTPFILVYLPYHSLGAFFRSQRHLTFFYITQFLNSVVVLTYIILNHNSPYDIPIATSLGTVFGFMFMILFSIKRFSLFGKIDFNYYKDIIRTFIPLFFIIGTSQLYNIIDRAFSSYLNSGAISAMYYTWMLTMIVPGVLSLSNLIITDLTLAKEPSKLINKLFYFAIYISVPIIVFVTNNKELIVDVVLNFGNLTTQNFSDAVTSLGLYIFILPSLLIWPIFYRYFQIIGKLKIIFVIAFFGVTFNVILNYMFMFLFHMGISGLIIATIINHIYSNIAIITFAKRKLNIDVYLFENFKRFIIVTLISSFALFLVGFIQFENEIVEFFAKGFIYVILYIFGMILSGFEEMIELRERFRRIIR